MTQTEKIIQSFLYMSLGAALTACSSTPPPKKPEPIPEVDRTYCFGIEEGKTCPSAEEVGKKTPIHNEDYCGDTIGKHLKVTAFLTQRDEPYIENTIDEIEPLPLDKGDSCCYKTRYQALPTREPNCIPGRPYMQEGKTVVARLEAKKGDWQHEELPISFGSTEERRIAGQFYLRMGLGEHASVASFNRFSLELMSLGAPAHLIQKAQEAALDEIRHAKRAFSIARSLLNKEDQPQQMSIDVHLAPNYLELAKVVLEEAAIQETLSVLLAAEQLRVAQCPVIVEYLREVVEDESRHAELAFETLRWCIEKGGSEVREMIQRRMEAPIKLSTASYPETAVQALGIPEQAKLQQMVRRGVEQVVLPSLRSLIDMEYT